MIFQIRGFHCCVLDGWIWFWQLVKYCAVSVSNYGFNYCAVSVKYCLDGFNYYFNFFFESVVLDRCLFLIWSLYFSLSYNLTCVLLYAGICLFFFFHQYLDMPSMASDGFFAMGDSSQKAFQSDEKRVDGNKENGFVNRLFFFFIWAYVRLAEPNSTSLWGHIVVLTFLNCFFFVNYYRKQKIQQQRKSLPIAPGTSHCKLLPSCSFFYYYLVSG